MMKRDVYNDITDAMEVGAKVGGTIQERKSAALDGLIYYLELRADDGDDRARMAVEAYRIMVGEKK